MTDIFIKVIEMSITASVVIAVIIVLRLLLRKAPKVFSYVLWAAALFRLLCPISFELPAAPVPSIELPYISNASDYSTNGSLMPNTAPDNAAFPEAAVQSEPDAQTQDMTQIQPSPAETAPAKKQINFIVFASYIWAAAVIAMAFRGVISWARLSKALRSAQKAGKNVYVSPAISDPFIMGIIRPKIYRAELRRKRAYHKARKGAYAQRRPHCKADNVRSSLHTLLQSLCVGNVQAF